MFLAGLCYWVSDDAPAASCNTLVYILEHESREAAAVDATRVE